MMLLAREFGRFDAWGAKWAAEGTDWGAYLERYLDRPDERPASDDPEFVLWQRYMQRDCLHLASVLASRMRLPVGRLMKGGQLAHAFVILPNRHGMPDRLASLDWSGVRRLKRIKDDMREEWGRLTLNGDMSPIDRPAARLGDAWTRPHIRAALDVCWPRVAATSTRGRLRYIDVLDCRPRAKKRRPDIIAMD